MSPQPTPMSENSPKQAKTSQKQAKTGTPKTANEYLPRPWMDVQGSFVKRTDASTSTELGVPNPTFLASCRQARQPAPRVKFGASAGILGAPDGHHS